MGMMVGDLRAPDCVCLCVLLTCMMGYTAGNDVEDDVDYVVTR